MKLKFANSLLVAALVVTAAGCFTSCKDTDEDMYNTLEDQYLSLGTKLQNDYVTLTQLKSELQSLQTTLEADAQAKADKALADAKAYVDGKGYVTEAEVKALIEDLVTCECNKDAIAELVAAIEEIQNLTGDGTTLAEYFAKIQDTLYGAQGLVSGYDDLSTKYNDLEPIVTQNQKDIADMKDDISEAKTQLSVLSELIDIVPEIKDIVANYDTDMQALKDQLDQMEKDLTKAMEAADQELQDQIDDINQLIRDIDTEVLTPLKNQVSLLQEMVDALLEQMPIQRIENLEKRITSMYVNQVTSPVFGSLSAPIDVQTMILFNYYGYAEHNLTFPLFNNDNHEINFNYGYKLAEGNTELLTADQIALLNTQPEQIIDANTTLLASNGNMGSVYFTANPAKLDLTSGYNFSLINSLGEEAPVTLANPVKAANKEILFGHTSRSTSDDDVVLWQADASMNVGDVPKVRVMLEEGLGTAVKDALKNRTLSNMAKVGALVYQTITDNSSLPAYGLKAQWEDNDGTQSCYAQFNMAAATFRPLGYATLAGQNLAQYMPTIPSFDQLLGDLTFDFGDVNIHFDIDDLDIDRVNIEYNLDIETIDVTVKFDDISGTVHLDFWVYYDFPTQVDPVTGDVIETETRPIHVDQDVEIESITEITEKIKEALDEVVSQINTDLEKLTGEFESIITQLQDQVNAMIDKVESELNDMLASLEENVNEQLSEVIKNLQDEVNGKIQSITDKFENYYSKFESAYNRISSLLEDPNHYMQCFMLYASNGKVGRLSTSQVAPSVWNSSTGAATLLATTYNAELLSPAYRKYVAITNVYKEDDRTVSAANGNAECIAALKAANNAEYFMDTVFDGDRQTVAFRFETGKNYTYEIFYQAADYHGFVSTRKYYVNVK
ncbi:MAG: hypothetical protein LIP03_03700 [Bacteroidales bacterium]|nr:hypothetical protein [Bacteroidales bacterium]